MTTHKTILRKKSWTDSSVGSIDVSYEETEGKRKAKCCYCSALTDSKPSLAFLVETPTKETDTYYCGCKGWD